VAKNGITGDPGLYTEFSTGTHINANLGNASGNVTTDNPLPVDLAGGFDVRMFGLMSQVLTELKKITLHLDLMNDNCIKNDDVEV
jgi:hypothetical protein